MAETSHEAERPGLLARPIFWMPFAIICIGGAVMHRRGVEKDRLGVLWEQRCLGDVQCEANIAKVSDHCHGEVISILHKRDTANSQRRRYVSCVVSIMQQDLDVDVEPPRDLVINYF